MCVCVCLNFVSNSSYQIFLSTRRQPCWATAQCGGVVSCIICTQTAFFHSFFVPTCRHSNVSSLLLLICTSQSFVWLFDSSADPSSRIWLVIPNRKLRVCHTHD